MQLFGQKLSSKKIADMIEEVDEDGNVVFTDPALEDQNIYKKKKEEDFERRFLKSMQASGETPLLDEDGLPSYYPDMQQHYYGPESTS